MGKLLTVVFSIAGLAATYYFGFTQGSLGSESKAHEILATYNNFKQRVKKDSSNACDTLGELKGVYKAEFETMVNLVGDKVNPYDLNPCNDLGVIVNPPQDLRITWLQTCKKWDSWTDFLTAKDASLGICIQDKSFKVELSKTARRTLFDGFHNQVEEMKATIAFETIDKDE